MNSRPRDFVKISLGAGSGFFLPLRRGTFTLSGIRNYLAQLGTMHAVGGLVAEHWTNPHGRGTPGTGLTMDTKGEVSGVLIVSRHPIVCAGFARLLEGQPGLAVVGEATDLANAVALAESRRPDLVILDIDAGLENVASTIGRILAVNARLRVLFVSGALDQRTEKEALAGGAKGVVSREAETGALLQMIRSVIAGEDGPPASGPAREADAAPVRAAAGADQAKLASLTRQERNVVTLVVAGLPNRSIATRLSISERTVRNHMTAILQKLNLTNRVELILFAYQHNLAPRLDASRVDGWQPSP